VEAPYTWTIASKLEQATACTVQELSSFHQAFLTTEPLALKVLVNGNAVAASASKIYQRIADVFARAPVLLPSSYPVFGAAVLPLGVRCTHKTTHANPSDVNSAFVLTMQLPPYPSIREQAGLRLLLQLLKQPFYSDLRTKQQLGYVVSSGGGVPFTGAATESITLTVRCAFSDRNLHSRMPLDPTHVRLK
jgi:insulysin